MVILIRAKTTYCGRYFNYHSNPGKCRDFNQFYDINFVCIQAAKFKNCHKVQLPQCVDGFN